MDITIGAAPATAAVTGPLPLPLPVPAPAADAAPALLFRVGRPEVLSDDSGYFWLFEQDNVELLVEVLDARAIDGAFWVLLVVTDRETGKMRTFEKPGFAFESAADTEHFTEP